MDKHPTLNHFRIHQYRPKNLFKKVFFYFFFKTQTIAISVDDSSIITHHNIEEKEVLAEPGSISESGAAHHEEVIKIDFVN